MATTIDVEKIKPILELMVEKMKALETDLFAHSAVLLSLKKALDASPEIDNLLSDARCSPDFHAMIAEKYAPLHQAVEQWNVEERFLEMLQDFEGPQQ
jgi:hypothetical protein